MATLKPKLIFNIDSDLLDSIDNFRYKNQFPSRAAAIIWLLSWALKQKPIVPKKKRTEESY